MATTRGRRREPHQPRPRLLAGDLPVALQRQHHHARDHAPLPGPVVQRWRRKRQQQRGQRDDADACAQAAGSLLYGRTESRLDSLRDQKVFTADLGAGAEYLFAVVGVAAYHRVEVTASDGTKIADFVVDVISDNYLRPLITAQVTGAHEIAILVLHPAVPDPRIHETGYRVGAWRWPRGRFLYGAKSPFFSWTRSPASTPYCETGDSSGERAL